VQKFWYSWVCEADKNNKKNKDQSKMLNLRFKYSKIECPSFLIIQVDNVTKLVIAGRD
jgi:hypothetical protein